MRVYIREPLTGKTLAYWDGEYVRKVDDGEVVVSIDGNLIREGVSGGKVLANLAGDFIREGISGGKVIASIYNDCICSGANGGNILYLIDSGVSDIEKCALAVAVLRISDRF